MWKFIKDFFGLIGGFFRFVVEALEVLNAGWEEVNEGLQKFNEEMKQKRLESRSAEPNRVDSESKIEC